MAHIVREAVRPGVCIFKVYTTEGALIYHGSSEAVATTFVQKIKEAEKSAERARKTSSDRSSN